MQSLSRRQCTPSQPHTMHGISRQHSCLAAQPSPSTSAPCHSRGQRHTCNPVDPILTLAATDPSALQDVIVGGAVTAAVGAALYSGLKQEPVPCELCAGNGGIKCFACSGAGSSMDLIDPDILEAQAGRKLARGFTSSSSSRPGSCRVCKGKGLVLCSKCKGTGYMSKF